MTDSFAIRTSRAVVAGGLQPAGIVVRDGAIAEILAPDAVPDGLDVHDVGDDVVMPGLIDAHVHINEPGRTEWEGFETATRAACAGGITTLVDMPLNSSPVTTTVGALREKLAAAQGKLFVDCGFYGGLVPDNGAEIPGLVDAGVLGVKAFLCHSGIDEFPNARREDLHAAMEVLARRGMPLLVHAELVDDEAPIDPSRPASYAAYVASRPQRFELRAIELLIELCRATGCPVHIVHLAAGEALPMLREARTEGLPITVETGPHYLLFASEEIPDGDTRYKCAPPIRDAHNRALLTSALLAGDIDLVGTDHSPAPPSIKELDSGDLQRAWGGISSLQLLLPALWTATHEAGATPTDIARWTSTRPAQLLGLDDRGALAPGRIANLTVWDPEASFTVHADALHHRHPVTPYDGRVLYGVVRSTYLRGHRIFDGHEISTTLRGRPLTSSKRRT
jgi:allantoinase